MPPKPSNQLNDLAIQLIDLLEDPDTKQTLAAGTVRDALAKVFRLLAKQDIQQNRPSSQYAPSMHDYTLSRCEGWHASSLMAGGATLSAGVRKSTRPTATAPFASIDCFLVDATKHALIQSYFDEMPDPAPRTFRHGNHVLIPTTDKSTEWLLNHRGEGIVRAYQYVTTHKSTDCKKYARMYAEASQQRLTESFDKAVEESVRDLRVDTAIKAQLEQLLADLRNCRCVLLSRDLDDDEAKDDIIFYDAVNTEASAPATRATLAFPGDQKKAVLQLPSAGAAVPVTYTEVACGYDKIVGSIAQQAARRARNPVEMTKELRLHLTRYGRKRTRELQDDVAVAQQPHLEYEAREHAFSVQRWNETIHNIARFCEWAVGNPEVRTWLLQNNGAAAPDKGVCTAFGEIPRGKQPLQEAAPPNWQYYQIDPDPEPLKAVTLQSHIAVPVIEFGLGGWWYAGGQVDDMHSFLNVADSAAPGQYQSPAVNDKPPLCDIIEAHIKTQFEEVDPTNKTVDNPLVRGFLRKLMRIGQPEDLATVVVPMRVMCRASDGPETLCIVKGEYVVTPQFAGAKEMLLDHVQRRLPRASPAVTLMDVVPLTGAVSGMLSAAVIMASCVRGGGTYSDPRGVEIARKTLDNAAKGLAEAVHEARRAKRQKQR